MVQAAQYDLFISYADADRAWVEGYLLDSLKQAGVRYHSEAAFALGTVRLLEFERAIQQSDRTLLVLSPAYLADGFHQFIDLLAQCYGFDSATWPVIPLVLQSVKLPPRLNALVKLNATNPDEWEEATRRLCAELKRPVPAPLPKPPCPYPGMVPFSVDDSDRFFGRDEEVEELLECLRLHPFMTAIGPSGSGKSSLVFAGLIPALRRSGRFGSGDWLVRTMRPGETPLAALKTTLGSDLANPALAVTEALAAQPYAQRLLLIVDQFEEVFTLAGQEAVLFQQALLRLAETPNCYVIVTVRADFYPELMGSPLWQRIKSHRLEVVPLDEAGLRKAIIRPAEDVGVFVEPALLERLIADAAGEPGVLPLIQETLVLLWEKVERRFLPLRAYEALVLSRKAYGALGNNKHTGLQVAIARRADAALADLSEEQQAIARRIFLRLIQFGEGRADTRRQQSVDALRATRDDPHLFDQTLWHLADKRLLTLSSDEKDSSPKTDIAHEALISGWPALQQWLTERKETEQTRRRLEAQAQEWVRLRKSSGGLLDNVELAEAQRWLSTSDATDLGYDEALPALVEASKRAIQEAEREKEERQQRELELIRERLEQEKRAREQEQRALEQERKARKAAQTRNRIAAISLVLLAGLTTYAFIQQDRAQKSRQEEQKQSVISLSKVSEAFLASNQQLEALVAALRVGRRLKDSSWGQVDVPIQTVVALEQAVYGIKERNRLEGHQDWVAGVSFSPDGKTIASASTDKTIKLWSLNGTLLKTFEGHQDGVLEVSFSPNGQTLASASMDKTIKLWNLDGKVLRTLPDSNWVSSVSFSPDGQIIAVACADKTVKLWRVSDGQLLQTFKEHTGRVMDVSFSPNGELIASASEDGTVKLWQRNGKPVKTFQGRGGQVFGVSFSPDGQAIASAHEDNTIKLWRLNGTLIRTLQGHRSSVLNVQFSPDGQMIASASYDGTVKLWRRDGMLLQTLEGHRNSVGSVRFSPDGKIVASGSLDKTVRIWNLNGIVPTILQHSGGVNSIKFSPDGQMLASASDDKTVKLWQRDGKLLQTFTGHNDVVLNASFSPDGKTIASASADKTVKLWSLDGKALQTLQGHQEQVSSVSFSPDGKILASASQDKTVNLWTPNGKLLRSLKGHQDWVNHISFSPDGKILASASADKTVKLWTPDSKLLQTLEGHKDSVLGLSFSPDGKVLASASADNTIRLWHRKGKSFEPLGQPFQGHSGSVLMVSFSPDGKILASASSDSTIKLWSLDGRLLQTLQVHKQVDKKDDVFDVSFSPDGKALASASFDGTVTVWNLNLDDLMVRGCNWVRDYLKTNRSLSDGDRPLCKGVSNSS